MNNKASAFQNKTLINNSTIPLPYVNLHVYVCARWKYLRERQRNVFKVRPGRAVRAGALVEGAVHCSCGAETLVNVKA